MIVHHVFLNVSVVATSKFVSADTRALLLVCSYFDAQQNLHSGVSHGFHVNALIIVLAHNIRSSIVMPENWRTSTSCVPVPSGVFFFGSLRPSRNAFTSSRRVSSTLLLSFRSLSSGTNLRGGFLLGTLTSASVKCMPSSTARFFSLLALRVAKSLLIFFGMFYKLLFTN